MSSNEASPAPTRCVPSACLYFGVPVATALLRFQGAKRWKPASKYDHPKPCRVTIYDIRIIRPCLNSDLAKAKVMQHGPPIPEGRRSKRVAGKKPARLVINLSGVQKMLPCIVIDRSQAGFRLRGDFRLRRGQFVELVLDDPMVSVRCEVIWVGKAGSGHEGEAGLQTVVR
jgi:hypothetical protein